MSKELEVLKKHYSSKSSSNPSSRCWFYSHVLQSSHTPPREDLLQFGRGEREEGEKTHWEMICITGNEIHH